MKWGIKTIMIEVKPYSINLDDITMEEMQIIKLLKNKNRMEQDQILAEIEREKNNVYE